MEISGLIPTNTQNQERYIEKFTPISDSDGISRYFIAQIDGKQFFMKQLKPEEQDNMLYRSLFRKEYEKGSTIRHPNIVEYINFVNDENDCYILMENIAGETLDKFMVSHPAYFKKRSNLDKFFNQLLDGLKCLHENHIVYSDLKPQNIMVTQVNNDVKIIDLGFCFTDAFTDSAGATNGFTAPEHNEDNGKLDITTDIYGIGKIIEYISKNSNFGIPGIYAKIMLKCLKERKEQRFQNTDEIVILINKRKHIMRRAIVTLITCTVLFLTYKTISYNEHFIAWWDSFEIIQHKIDYDFEYRHVLYRILPGDNGTCEAAGPTTAPNIYIHSEVENNGKKYKVTHIGDSAFRYKTHIKSVHIPEGIRHIGKEAFRECKNIATIFLPSSVTEIEDYAFYACENVYNLHLPPSITEIPVASFCGNKIKKVEIPEGVTIIKLDAFGNCIKLKEVCLPTTLTVIERGAFYNCASLESITIPQNVKQIGEYLFFKCDKLKDIFNLSTEPQVIPPIHKNPAQITLHVPAESVMKYRNADYWKEMNIVPIEN